MASLTSLLRKSDCIVTDSIHYEWITSSDRRVRVVYNSPYDTNWTDKELCSNIIQLYCSNNQLTSLPDLPLCTKLDCHNNQLPFDNLYKWKKVWRVKKLLLGRKYFTRWRVFVFATRRRDLHDELKYSPELPFYRDAIAERLSCVKK